MKQKRARDDSKLPLVLMCMCMCVNVRQTSVMGSNLVAFFASSWKSNDEKQTMLSKIEKSKIKGVMSNL